MAARRLIATLFGLVLVLALGALRLADPYPVAALREIAFDFFQRLQPRAAADFPVRVIDIDEAALGAVGQWPWPRATMAKLNDRLAELGAAAIAWDVLFPEADRIDPAGDAAFAASLAKTPSILGFSTSHSTTTLPVAPKSGIAISGVNPLAAVPKMDGAVLPLRQLLDAAPGLGSVSLNSGDSISDIRRVPLLWSNGEQFFPTLSVEALRLALGVQTLVVLGETEGPGFVEGVRIGEITVPTTSTGDLWLHYRTPQDSLYLSAAAIVGDDFAASAPLVARHIVLIGASASGLVDLHGTPLGNLPGVAIHAQAIEQMMAGAYLIRADWVSGLEILGFLVAGFALVFVVLRLGPRAGLVAGAIVVAGTAAFAWYMFTAQGVMIDPSFPAIGSTLVYGAMVFFQFAITDADKRQIRRAFGHYVSPALLAEIERSGELKLGGEVRELTIMFCDVRGFTPLSERLAPPRMLSVLNTLFGALGAEVLAHYGTIDKFVGDAIMAFWNAPIDVPEHALRACRTALGMRARLAALNAADGFGLRADKAGTTLAAGIGIATGDAIVGNIGLESRFDYSCLGDTVNTASRVESGCKEVHYDILVTAAVKAAAPSLAYLYGGALELKGKSQREPVFLLVGDEKLAASGVFGELAAAHLAAVKPLATGHPDDMAIARCTTLAKTIEPGLASFYAAMADRPDDWLSTGSPSPLAGEGARRADEG